MWYNTGVMIFAVYMLTLQACSSSEEKSVVRAVEGDTVTLTCNRTIHEPVDWNYRRTDNSSVVLICADGFVYSQYQPKFGLSDTNDTLIINNVTLNDTGVYWCTEEAGMGRKHYVELFIEPRIDTETATPDFNTIIGVSVSIAVLLLSGIGVGVGIGVYKKRKHKKKKMVSKKTSSDEVPPEELRNLTGTPSRVDREATETETQLDETDFCDHIQVRKQLATEINTDSPICGIAHLENKIFVLCIGSNDVTVYDCNGERLSVIKIRGLRCPQDIVACTEGRSLYIADYWSPGCVWRVTVNGSPCVKKFLPNAASPEPCRPWSLSVRSNRLLVTADGDKLMTYDIGTMTRESVLSLPGLEVKHAVETERGSFIVCQWQPWPTVSEIDNSGTPIRGYMIESDRGCPSKLLLLPSGTVLVVDSHFSRILSLNKELRLERIQLDSTNNNLVKSPLHVCHVRQTNRLIVGSTLTARIQIFVV